LVNFANPYFFLHRSVVTISKTAKAIEIFLPIGENFIRLIRTRRT